MAAGLTILLFSWPSDEDRLTLSTAMDVDVDVDEKVAVAKVSSLASTVMESPNFTGEDAKGRHWGVKAVRAVQTMSENSETVKLEGIEAFSTSATGDSVRFKAKEGVYAVKGQDISLNKSVEVEGYGYKLKSTELKGNMRTQRINSSKPVEIKGLKGEIKAGAFLMEGSGGRVLFSEGVKIKYYPQRVEKDLVKEVSQ
mgnify:CR=1 FL=1|tara:strand:+ start:21202 stop:21795 length:594 start_codon:yes stop_codon:yes gene_type:complete